MDTTRFVYPLAGTLFSVFLLIPNMSKADDFPHQADVEQSPQKQISTLHYAPPQSYEFVMTPSTEEAETALLLSRIEPAAAPANQNNKRKFTSDDDRDYKEKLIEKIPFGDKMHRSWKIIDGDVDLYFQGLRADRNNKGVEYSSSSIPFIGDIEDIEWKVDAGEDMKLTFESKALPFVDIEGFNFKTTVSDDDTKAYARYTITFD